MITYNCPNCGANIERGENRETARCKFCGTEIKIPDRRRQLEAERNMIFARTLEWQSRIDRATAYERKDLLLPPAGCCGIYVAVFFLGSLVLATYRNAVAVIAIVAAIAGAVAIAWHGEKRRKRRRSALEFERAIDRKRSDKRLREIEAELGTLRE